MLEFTQELIRDDDLMGDVRDDFIRQEGMGGGYDKVSGLGVEIVESVFKEDLLLTNDSTNGSRLSSLGEQGDQSDLVVNKL